MPKNVLVLVVVCLLVWRCSSDETVAPIGNEDLIEACVRAAVCGVRIYPRVQNCVDTYHELFLPQGISPAYDKVYACMNDRGGDCEKIIACFGPEANAGECDRDYQASCDGVRAVSCDLISKRAFALDCEAANMECFLHPEQSFIAKCAPMTCTQTSAARCVDEMAVSCSGAIPIVDDCEAQGMKCVSAGAAAGCLPSVEVECDPKKFVPRCEGNRLIRCVQDWEVGTDCSQQANNRKCQSGKCVPSGQACTDDDFDRCSGVNLESCLDGQWRTIDCAALGFGACETLQNGALCSVGK